MEISQKLETEISRARQAGLTARENELRAVAVRYEPESGMIMVDLNNGCCFGIPYQKLEGLETATQTQLDEVEISPSGYGLHWESLDVDLAISEMVRGLFGTKAWMSQIAHHGGKSTSIAKQNAARKNGKKGGRPKLKITKA
jgi:hypothetical protein